MIHIALDTSGIGKTKSQKEASYLALKRLIKANQLTIHAPYVVKRELETQELEYYLKEYRLLKESLRKFLRVPKSEVVHKIINDIQHKTEVVVKEATSSSVVVREQMDAVEKADIAFKTIFEGMDQIENQLKEMVGSIDEIVSSKDKTKISMESISSVSEETAATTEQVSDATQEQIEGIQKVSEFAQELNEVVDNLNTAISQFKVD